MAVYRHPFMFEDAPEIWVRLHCDTGMENGTGIGFWECGEGKGGDRYVVVSRTAPHLPGDLFACEEIPGFGYGSTFADEPSAADESWAEWGAWYRPAKILE